MPVLARESLIRRLAEALRRGRTCVVLGGPQMGKTTVAQAAAELCDGVAVIELCEDADACEQELARTATGPCIRTGGLALARALAGKTPADVPADERSRRFPLLPLLRRDLERWTERAGERISREELVEACAATGGHPSLFARWLDLRRHGLLSDAIEKTLLDTQAPLFARIDAALADPELALVYAWLERSGPASVAALRRATGASKPLLDRLVLVGPVSRSLGERAQIRISCELYARHRRMKTPN